MYDKLQELWVKETGLKVGDKVKVLKRFENHELGLLIPWNPEMSETIGEVGEVICINTNSIGVNFGDDDWYYPFTVLEKVEVEEKTKPDVPDTCREVLFLSRENEWEVGFYFSESGSWEVRGVGLGFLRLADGEVKEWKELPNKKED